MQQGGCSVSQALRHSAARQIATAAAAAASPYAACERPDQRVRVFTELVKPAPHGTFYTINTERKATLHSSLEDTHRKTVALIQFLSTVGHLTFMMLTLQCSLPTCQITLENISGDMGMFFCYVYVNVD